MTMETYILRIYRRDPSDPSIVVGVAERADRKGKKRFRNLEELAAILSSQTNASGQAQQTGGAPAWKKDPSAR